MKKWLAIILAMMMAMTAFAAFAEEETEAATPVIPTTIEEYGDLATVSLDAFATMTTKTKDGETTVTLSQAVDSLQANWMGEGEEPEDLTVGEDLTATVTVSGHKQQLGSSKSGGMEDGDSDYIWEWDHDYEYPAGTDPEVVATKVQEVYDYMYSGEFEKTEAASYIVDNYANVWPEVVVDEPYAYVGYEAEVDGEYESDFMVLDVFVTDEELQAAKEEMAAKHADVPNPHIYSGRNEEGYAWGRLWGANSAGLVGAPNHAFVTKQAGFNVIYGRNGKVMQISKDIENADYFGVGTGTAHLVYQMTNVGWRLATVTMEYPEGSKVSAIQAKYNGNGDLYGSAIK